MQDGGDRVVQHGSHTSNIRLTEKCSVDLPCTSLILDIHVMIDTCQNKVSADQYHMTILQAQVYTLMRSHVFLKLTADQVLVFDWIAGLCQVNGVADRESKWEKFQLFCRGSEN